MPCAKPAVGSGVALRTELLPLRPACRRFDSPYCPAERATGWRGAGGRVPNHQHHREESLNAAIRERSQSEREDSSCAAAIMPEAGAAWLACAGSAIVGAPCVCFCIVGLVRLGR